MQARVTRTTASLGSTMVASGTFSTRTSFLPYMMVARMACLSSWCKAQELSGARRSVRAQQGPGPIEIPGSRSAGHSEKKGHLVRHARGNTLCLHFSALRVAGHDLHPPYCLSLTCSI